MDDKTDDPLLKAFEAQHWTFQVSAPRGTKADMYLALREPGKPERLLWSLPVSSSATLGVIPTDGSGVTTSQRLRVVAVSDGMTGRDYLPNPLKGVNLYRIATASTPPRPDGAYVLLETDRTALVCFFRESGWLNKAQREGRVESTSQGIVAKGSGW